MFEAELITELAREQGLRFSKEHSSSAGLLVVYADRFTDWNYYVSSGFGQWESKRVIEWTGYLTVTATGTDCHRDILELRGLGIDTFYDAKMQARTAVAALAAHRRAGFPGIAIPKPGKLTRKDFVENFARVDAYRAGVNWEQLTNKQRRERLDFAANDYDAYTADRLELG